MQQPQKLQRLKKSLRLFPRDDGKGFRNRAVAGLLCGLAVAVRKILHRIQHAQQLAEKPVVFCTFPVFQQTGNLRPLPVETAVQQEAVFRRYVAYLALFVDVIFGVDFFLFLFGE